MITRHIVKLSELVKNNQNYYFNYNVALLLIYNFVYEFMCKFTFIRIL